MKKRHWQITLLLLSVCICFFAYHPNLYAATASNQTNSFLPGLHLSLGTSNSRQSVDSTVQIVLLLTVLSVAPAILLLMTSFTRMIVVLSFVRSALALQQSPPNQVLIGLALFLTFFVMEPTFQQANQHALQPFLAGKLSESAALRQAEIPFKQFMAKQTRPDDLQLFLQFRHMQTPKNVNQIPMSALVPAYTISELKTAFQIGFMIYLPFLVIDLVVSTTLMSMGMMMLPPVIISLPFKILLFVMVDGWHLVVQSLLSGYS
ncbi:flagellar type III secretion system pore protein FliP [Alicyclobacillus tolerans]|uniref:Flagellar biosynthetic protein FliP n=1 Tax=Alicyclobacillus tolerans TaxID=90970 RepID=A0ABT9LX62_9BACL|nr:MULTISPECIES: flagellar type III secretion system pore protein FliP [Alicyclobacillus]MDP9728858.1 flagellar biosynthetic protein FliP [Alicyclobacillus tengchongensis]QRF23708.1 flagellar type III secretion system pore protein FliP [Alicyclobacillus sp. TC]